MHAELIRGIRVSIAGDLGDPLLNTWILWWNAQQVPLTDAYWNAPSFAPMSNALALSETLLGLTWLTTPLQWMGASALTAYNVMLIVAPLLNGLSAYWLCLVLTSRRDAACIGAIAFAFAPYHAARLSHLQTEMMFFMPLALVGLHRYWATNRPGWLALLAASTALNALACGYFLLYFGVLLVIAVAWLAVSSGDLKKAAAVIAAIGIAAVALAPVMMEYRAVRGDLGLTRPGIEDPGLSADVSSIALGSNHLAVWPIQTPSHRSEIAAYPGIVVLGLLMAAALVVLLRRPEPLRLERPPMLLMVVAGLAIATIAYGAIAVERPYKVIGAALDVLLIVALVSKPYRNLIRSGSIPAMYVMGFIAAALLSLGPVGRVFGHRFWYKAPFAWLMTLPGYDWARVPARFSSIEVLCLAVLAAFAVVRLWPKGVPLLVTATIAALIIVDGWRVVPVVRVPAPSPAALSADLVIELPTQGWAEDVRAMYRGSFHRRPVMNGYSGFVPPQYAPLQAELRANCVKSIEALRAGRSVDAVVWREAPGASAIDSSLRQMWPTAAREEMTDVIVYRQPRSAPANLTNVAHCR